MKFLQKVYSGINTHLNKTIIHPLNKNEYFLFFKNQTLSLVDSISNNEHFKIIINHVENLASITLNKISEAKSYFIKEHDFEAKDLKKAFKFVKELFYLMYPQFRYLHFILEFSDLNLDMFKETKEHEVKIQVNTSRKSKELDNLFDIIEFINNLNFNELKKIAFDLEITTSVKIEEIFNKINSLNKKQLRALIYKQIKEAIKKESPITIEDIKNII